MLITKHHSPCEMSRHKFMLYFSSELICKFFLVALTWRWLPYSQASSMNDRPEQTSSISRYSFTNKIHSMCQCTDDEVKQLMELLAIYPKHAPAQTYIHDTLHKYS